MALTALLGWLPALMSLLAVQIALARGAREWAALTFDVTFVGLYSVLLGVGAWIYARWFG
jgi:hypothetical protein